MPFLNVKMYRRKTLQKIFWNIKCKQSFVLVKKALTMNTRTVTSGIGTKQYFKAAKSAHFKTNELEWRVNKWMKRYSKIIYKRFRVLKSHSYKMLCNTVEKITATDIVNSKFFIASKTISLQNNFFLIKNLHKTWSDIAFIYCTEVSNVMCFIITLTTSVKYKWILKREAKSYEWKSKHVL